MGLLTIDRKSLRLFGVDLAALPGFLRDGWAEALRCPALRWLTPDEAVRVIHADGTESVRHGVSARRIAAPGRVRFAAVELAEEVLLRRSLLLPRLGESEVRQTVELDVQAASPFPEQELRWGYSVEPGERLRVDIALTAQQMIERQIERARPKLGGIEPEVWVGGERPFVIPGFGEAARLARARRMRRGLFALLAVTAVLLAALAITPTLQLRERAIEAERRNDELTRAVAPQLKLRDDLARVTGQIGLLQKAAAAQPEVVALIDRITRHLPDDVVVNRLEIAGGKVRITGQADNAALLLQTLGADPAFHEVRAPGAITRAPAGSKEGFTIEFGVGAEAKPR